MSDDLERTLTESLDRHARRLGSRPEAHLDAVWSRLDRRRHDRRRNVAAVGSVIAVGAGVTGIMLVGGGDAAAPAAGDGAPITTLAGIAWRCTGLFGDDGTYRYYTDCTPVAELPPLTTERSGYPDMPTTTIVSLLTAPPTIAPPLASPPVATTAPIMTEPFVTYPDGIGYEVQQGDSLAAIAQAFGVRPEAIAGSNGWDDGLNHVLLPGDSVHIPLPPASTAAPAVTAPPIAPSSSYVTVPTWPVCEDLSGDVPVSVPCATVPATTAIATDVFATTAPPASPPLPAPANSFRCSGFLGTDGAFEYLQACDTIGPDGAVEPDVAPPTLVPVSTVVGTLPPSVVTNPPMPSTLPPATTAPPLVSPVEQTYVLRPGDNPTRVADVFGITVEALRDANPGVIDTFIVGQVLIIPPGAIVVDPSELAGRTRVPPLVGLTEGQARDLLAATGLFVSEIAYVDLPAGDTSDGVVVEQRPVAGTEVEPGRRIDLSLGRAASGGK